MSILLININRWRRTDWTCEREKCILWFAPCMICPIRIEGIHRSEVSILFLFFVGVRSFSNSNKTTIVAKSSFEKWNYDMPTNIITTGRTKCVNSHQGHFTYILQALKNTDSVSSLSSRSLHVPVLTNLKYVWVNLMCPMHSLARSRENICGVWQWIGYQWRDYLRKFIINPRIRYVRILHLKKCLPN